MNRRVRFFFLLKKRHFTLLTMRWAWPFIYFMRFTRKWLSIYINLVNWMDGRASVRADDQLVNSWRYCYTVEYYMCMGNLPDGCHMVAGFCAGFFMSRRITDNSYMAGLCSNHFTYTASAIAYYYNCWWFFIIVISIL